MLAVGGDSSDDEEVRFTRVEQAPVDVAPPVPWQGGMRDELSGVVDVESRLRALGASPEQAVLVSAQLDWGKVDRNARDGLSFTGAGMTVRARRLSDGEVLQQGTVVDETGTYDLSDPDQRNRLCTRAQAGDLGEIELHTWTGTEPASNDPSILMVDGAQRTAMIDLKPGESVTMVEVVAPERRRKMRVRRALTVERGDKVMTLTEGDLLQRVCVEF